MRRPTAPPPEQITCTDCERTFSRRPDLERHHREVHQEERFPCTYPGCLYKSTRKDRTRKHRDKYHPGAFTTTTEFNTDNTMQNQGQGNYPNAQASTSAQDSPSSFQTQPNQTYNDWYSTQESINSATYTAPVSHDQPMYYSGPNNYQAGNAGSSYETGWVLGTEASQEQWNGGDSYGKDYA